MEQQQRQLVEIPDAFNPRRKPLLKSETYFSMLRLFSFCDNQLPPLVIKPGSNSSDEADRKACVQVGGSDGDCLAQKSKAHDQTFECLGQRGFSETKVLIDEIECIMTVDEDEDQLTHNCSVLDKIMELDHAIKGNDDFRVDCNEIRGVTAGERTCLDSHPLCESRIVSEQTIQEEGSICDVSKLLDSKVARASQESGSKLKEIITLEKSSIAMVCPNGMVVGDQAEEGEIYVDYRIGEGADLKSCKDNRKLQGIKLDEKHLSSHVLDGTGCRKQSASSATPGNQFPSSSRADGVANLNNGYGNKDKIDIPMVSNRKTVVYDDLLFTEGPEMWQEGKKGDRAKGQRINSETAGRNNNNRGGEVGKVKGHAEQNKGSAVKVDARYADMSVENTSQDPSTYQVSACGDKQDGSLCKNKKRGPLTDARKESRKRNKRKKRAETNKEHGVKRLKLQPVSNQKPAAVCRHYMMGRCQEDEKCKFSHDAIPLTKSKPCSHFARDQCIKMDKCPYDHQLSKYPCDKYKTTGFCIRGEKCLFSHKDLPNEVSTVGSAKPKSSVLTGNVGTKRKLDIVDNLHQKRESLSVPAAVAPAKIQQVGRKDALNALGIAPTGIAGKSLVGVSNCTLQGPSSVATKDALNINHTDQHSSGLADKSNTPLKGTPPAATPKGINFLSFGKSPLLLSAAKQSSVKPISFDESLKPPLSKMSSPYKQVSDAGGVKRPSEFNVIIPKTNEMAHRTGHVTESPKHDTLFPRVTSADECNRHIQAHLPSSSHGGTSITREGSKTAYDKHHSLKATLQGLLSSSSDSGQSSGHRELLQLKYVPNSVQDSLMSMLAFAAKVDSDMKKKI